MYRMFWLENSLENKFKFIDNEEVDVFLNNPTGLGLEKTYDTTRIGSIEIINNAQNSLLDFSGEIIFFNKDNSVRYQNYYDFIQFLKYKPLKLYYRPANSSIDYYSDILLSKLEKGDSNEDGTLRVNMSVHRLTQWLRSDPYDTTPISKGTAGTGKYYDLERDYHYSGHTLQNISVVNTGTDSVGFTFEVNGSVQNPQFSLSQNGDIYGVCKLSGTFDYVKVNSVEDEEQIYLENNGSVLANPTSYQDFTVATGSNYVTFIKLAVGESILNFTCGNIDSFTGTIRIKFFQSYASV